MAVKAFFAKAKKGFQKKYTIFFESGETFVVTLGKPSVQKMRIKLGRATTGKTTAYIWKTPVGVLVCVSKKNKDRFKKGEKFKAFLEIGKHNLIVEVV